MKPSLYNIIHLKEGQTPLLWNTMSGALVSVSKVEAEALRRGQVPGLPETRKSFFAEKGILIPSGRNETEELEKEIQALQDGTSGLPGDFYRIFTTTACNASCGYCYERGVQVRTMDMGTACQTAEFIRRQGKHGIPFLEWFGGEPLLYPEIISEICRGLLDEGVPFVSRIVTNGSLWTDQLIRTAAEEWHLKSAQVTLDGIGTAHEDRKGLERGAFEQTVRSIRNLSEHGIRADIRINHFEGEDQRELADWIQRAFSDAGNVRAFAVPGYRKGPEYPRPLMLEVVELNRILGRTGPFGPGRTILPRRIHTGCFACHPGNFTIGPEGDLYSCSHALSEDQRIGDIRDGVTDPDRKRFPRKSLSAACRICPVLPVCMGGCRAAETGIAPMTQCPPVKAILPEIMELAADSLTGTVF